MIWMKSLVRPPLACADGVDESPQPGNEAVVPDPQQRTAGDVAHAGRLDDDDAGLPAAKRRTTRARRR